jgi:hypothetical protein
MQKQAFTFKNHLTKRYIGNLAQRFRKLRNMFKLRTSGIKTRVCNERLSFKHKRGSMEIDEFH